MCDDSENKTYVSWNGVIKSSVNFELKPRSTSRVNNHQTFKDQNTDKISSRKQSY